MVEASELWRRGFQDASTNPHVQRLVTSLRSLRKNAQSLASRIAGSLPDLTIHDVSHLDALWDVASIVAGPCFPLNPLEAYIFGSAVLLHDAGLSFDAYSGGRDAVRSTMQWRDSYGRLARSATQGLDIYREADFEALRALHASQATTLAIRPWRHEQHGELYLIDDSDLRENYGSLIGEIASSHHWKLEDVVRRFYTPRPPAAFLENDWLVDSLKIACLLRVADAGHMDSARAPSFLLRILQMNSVSRAHWAAQNRLGRLTVSTEDPAQLTIASTSPFPRTEAAAWWVAFDLVCLFDKELRECNDALENLSASRRTSFAAKRVTGSGNNTRLVKYIETLGWKPTESTVHVSDVSALVRTLGGEQLYGSDVDHLHVALREMIQNAADAIHARRALGDIRFVGRITIRLQRRRDGVWVLQVDDNGVGMSQATLSEDLLDFGRSFWVSRRAAREFPGIHASTFTPVGRFGIGFFSIFMAADEVRVFSRRFNEGLEGVRCLSFENGISLRPTLSADRPADFGMDTCTRVELELKRRIVADPNQIEIRCNLMGYDNFHVTFNDYVAAMVAGIDVPVFVESAAGHVNVHGGFPPTAEETERWLRSLSYVAAGVNQRAVVGLNRVGSRLRMIRDGDRVLGLAAIDVLRQRGGLFLSAKSVGGLVAPHNRYDTSFVGLIEHNPANAKREAGEIAVPRDSMDTWMTEQLDLLRNANLTPDELLLASYSVCQLDHDPLEIVPGLFVTSAEGSAYWPMRGIADRLQSGCRLGFTVSAGMSSLDCHMPSPVTVAGMWTCVVLQNGKFNKAQLSAGAPAHAHSLIGVVHRVLIGSGYSPQWTVREAAYSSFVGRGDILEVSI